jgi:hypothetical protein
MIDPLVDVDWNAVWKGGLVLPQSSMRVKMWWEDSD